VAKKRVSPPESRKSRLPKAALRFFQEHGREGGLIGGSAGGKKAADSLTPKQRTERAKKAVAAREAKRKTVKPKKS
jgi:hypothetical protein